MANTNSRGSRFVRGVLVPIVAAFLAVTALIAPASPGVSQVAADTPRLKAVFVVGPTHGSTWSYLERGEEMAQEAEDAGMDVRRVFFPNATWERVLEHAQGANLLVYMGHGYGWPSPYTGKMTESRQNGMGLNSFAGSATDEYKYYGATPICQNIRLAPNAVVILMHGCYTAGNGESGMPIPSPDLARERVDNFANGFLAAGAGAMFALAWGTRIDYPAALVNTNQTMDQLFMTPADHVGWNDMYFNSVRTPGARNHLDPHPDSGYHRAVTGRLNMTTADWRAGAGQIVPPPPPPPGVPMIEMPAPSKARFFASDSDSILPSTLLKVKLAVPASLHWRILNASGTTVRTIRNGQTPAGTTGFTWNGRNDAGAFVAQGSYRVVASGQTAQGDFSAERNVFMGAFQINPAAPAVRGSNLKVKLVSTEKLSGSPRVTVSQPGHAARTFTATKTGTNKYTVTIPVLNGATGTLTIVVAGTDTKGGQQSSSVSLQLN